MIPDRIKSQAFDIAAESHIGFVRKTNQDRFFLREFPDGAALTAIADGLGGVPAGDMAADLVVETLSRVDALEPGTEEGQLIRLALRLDRIVAAAQQSQPRLGGMGSTMILHWMKNSRAYWVHVGDSRLYLLRDRRLLQITQDQTLARFLVAEGEITAEQAKGHYAREVLNQCLGCGFCDPENGSFRLTPGDVLLLSTDGLHRSMTAERLEALLNADTGTPDMVCALVEEALAAGGRDNITGVVTKIEKPGNRAVQKGGGTLKTPQNDSTISTVDGRLLQIVNHLSRQNISMCWYCLACGGGCPFAGHMDLLPGRLKERPYANGLERSLKGLRYVPYYGCLLASPPELNHYPRLYGSMETVITRLGARQCQWAYQAKCCGAFLSVARPDIVTPMVDAIVGSAIAAGAECIVTACAMCQLNLELRSTANRRLPVFSIIELLAYGLGSDDWPDWFAKHLIDPVPLFENRKLSN